MSIYNRFQTLNIVYIGSMHPTDTKICGFVGYAGRTDIQVVAEALSWRRDINDAGFGSVDAFPGDDGEILVSGIQDEFTYEIVVENDLSFSCSLTRDEVVLLSISRATKKSAVRSLEEAAAVLWTSSGGLKKISSTPARTVSPELHSESLLEPTEACP